MVLSSQCHIWRIGTCRGITQDHAIPHTHFHKLKWGGTSKVVRGLRVWWRPQGRNGRGRYSEHSARNPGANLRRDGLGHCGAWPSDFTPLAHPYIVPLVASCRPGWLMHLPAWRPEPGWQASVPSSFSSWGIVPESTQSPSTDTSFPKRETGHL